MPNELLIKETAKIQKEENSHKEIEGERILEQKQIGIKKEFRPAEKFDIPKQRVVDF